jgi:hypothetical protein
LAVRPVVRDVLCGDAKAFSTVELWLLAPGRDRHHCGTSTHVVKNGILRAGAHAAAPSGSKSVRATSIAAAISGLGSEVIGVAQKRECALKLIRLEVASLRETAVELTNCSEEVRLILYTSLRREHS